MAEPRVAGTTTAFRRGIRVVITAARTHPRPFSIAMVGATTFGLATVAGTVVLGRVTDRIVVPAFDEGVPGRTIALGAVALVAVAVVRAAGVVVRRYFAGTTTYRMQQTWRTRLSHHYLSVPVATLQATPTGQLLAHADNDVEIATMAINPLPFSLGVGVLAIAALVSLVAIDWSMLLVGVALFPGLALLNLWYTRRVELPAAETQARLGHVSALAHESFDGALVVKTLGREDAEVSRLATAADELRATRVRVGRLRASFEPTLDALPTLGIVALLMIGSWRISHGALTTGDLVQAMALFGVLAFPMRVVGFLFEELPRAAVASDRLHGVLSWPVWQPAHGRSDGGATRRLPAGPLGVRFERVAFGYAGHDVLRDVSLVAHAGETVALVGATGAGKSTMCHLLAHLARPREGAVRVGDVPLSAVPTDDLRARVAVVFQETFLFADSVRANLVLDRDVDEPTLAWALRAARADAFVRSLPHGLDTVLGERGVTLSGGQRQRLSIARALAGRPGVIVLDDATSAVDPNTEAEILTELGDLDTTVLLVAHRLAAIERADHVVLLDHGRVRAAGQHRDLLGDPAYAALMAAY